MKRENSFVAQLFHYLAPFVDMEKELFICVDGATAAKYSPDDPDLPDLWFTFCGHKTETGIEAKVINEKNSISIRQGQMRAWRTGGKGAYQPTFWVAANRALTEFFCWHHADFRPLLDSSNNKNDNVTRAVTKYFPIAHRSSKIAELALYILTHHRTSGARMKTKPRDKINTR